MKSILVTALLVVGVLIVITIMMQPSKQQDALSALSGGAGDLFAERKSRGFEAIMRRTTAVLMFIWFMIGIAIMYISAK